MEFAECLFYAEDRHQTRSIPLNGSNQWVLKEHEGAACQECTIIWKDIYTESGRPGTVGENGVWYPPPRKDVVLWSDDYHFQIGMIFIEDNEGNSLSPPGEDVEAPGPASSSSSHQSPNQGSSPSSAHQPAQGSVYASSRIPAPGSQAQPASSDHQGRSMLDPPVGSSSSSQAAGSMASGSQARLPTWLTLEGWTPVSRAPAPASIPAPVPYPPPFQMNRPWCNECRDSSTQGWRDGRCDYNDPCSRCIMANLPCTNDGDPRQGIRPFCDRCRGGAHRDCDKGYPSCGHCEREGAECRYNPAINGRAPR